MMFAVITVHTEFYRIFMREYRDFESANFNGVGCGIQNCKFVFDLGNSILLAWANLDK
jgi:hypothetical protein